MRRERTRLVALTGVLFALALALGFFESFLAGLMALPPGVKPGLANIVVMFCLLCFSRRQALLLVLLKAGFGGLTRGLIAGALSLAGGLLAFLVMVFLLWLPKAKPSVLVISVCGALAHNLAQMLVVSLLFGQGAWVYAPVLVLSGVGMGCLTALLLKTLLPPLQRTGLTTVAPGEITAKPGNETGKKRGREMKGSKK